MILTPEEMTKRQKSLVDREEKITRWLFIIFYGIAIGFLIFALKVNYAKAEEPYGGGGGGSWGDVGMDTLYSTYPTSTNSDYQLITGVMRVSTPGDGWFPDESKFIAFKWQTDTADLYSFEIWANRIVVNSGTAGVDNEDLLFSVYELSADEYQTFSSYSDGLTYDPYNTGEYEYLPLTMPEPIGYAWIDGNYIPTTASPNGTNLTDTYKIKTNIPIKPIRLIKDNYYLIRISRQYPCMVPYLFCGDGGGAGPKYAFEIGYVWEDYISETADNVQTYSTGYTYSSKPVFTARRLNYQEYTDYTDNKILAINLYGVFTVLNEDISWSGFVDSLKYKVPHGYLFLIADELTGWTPNATTSHFALEFAVPPLMPTSTEPAVLDLTEVYLSLPQEARDFGHRSIEILALLTFTVYVILRAVGFFKAV